MKKLLFTLLTLSVLGSGFAQRSIDMRLVEKALHPQSLRATRNDIAPSRAIYHTNEDAIVKYRDSFTYNEDEYFLESVETQFLDLGTWYPSTLTTYEYDYNLMPIEILEQKYDDEWIDDEKTTLQYSSDPFNPLLEQEIYERMEDGDWFTHRTITYNYDPNTTILIKDWNGSTFANHFLYTIDEESLSTTVLLQYWYGGAWQNQEKVEISYNHDLSINERITYQWVDEAWSNDVKEVFLYDGPFKLKKVTKTLWDNGEWSPNKVKTVNYISDWMGSKHAVCESNYGGGDELNTDIEMLYNEGETLVFEHVNEVEIEYIDVTEVNEHASQSHLNISPNPATDRVEIGGEHFLKAELYDLSGKKVAESLAPVINVTGLSAGTYLMRVTQDNGVVETHKILVR